MAANSQKEAGSWCTNHIERQACPTLAINKIYYCTQTVFNLQMKMFTETFVWFTELNWQHIVTNSHVYSPGWTHEPAWGFDTSWCGIHIENFQSLAPICVSITRIQLVSVEAELLQWLTLVKYPQTAFPTISLFGSKFWLMICNCHLRLAASDWHYLKYHVSTYIPRIELQIVWNIGPTSYLVCLCRWHSKWSLVKPEKFLSHLKWCVKSESGSWAAEDWYLPGSSTQKSSHRHFCPSSGPLLR